MTNLVKKQETQATQRFGQFEPQSLGEAHKLFDVLIKTGYLPQHIKHPQQAIAIWLLARERGIGMMTALLGMYVVRGKPAFETCMLVGLIRKSGLCKHWRVIKSTAEECVIEAQRVDDVEPTTIKYTWDNAKAQQLTSRDSYKKQPEVMLTHRCGMKAARQLFPEIASGVYSPDEIENIPKQQNNSVVAKVTEIIGATPEPVVSVPNVYVDIQANADQDTIDPTKILEPETKNYWLNRINSTGALFDEAELEHEPKKGRDHD